MSKDKCPHCGKPVYNDDALRCLFCGRRLEKGVGFLGKIKYSTPRIILGILITLLTVSFLILIIF